MAMADDDTVLTQPTYKTVTLTFGDAAITLRGDGSLDGDVEAFTAALETINPAADDVAFAVGWLVARCEELRRTVTTEQVLINGLMDRKKVLGHRDKGETALAWNEAASRIATSDPDPGDADPMPGVDERPIAVDDGIRDRLSERATHDAAQARVARDYNA